ncbi:hypothetical protein COO60DRAFT_891466 [Scenedesmus sp. NREL 46B-D3]|nr:hypothetical protein COO60DRAFT_891466 [Scenedesmus sp. NREL 46B-D3]
MDIYDRYKDAAKAAARQQQQLLQRQPLRASTRSTRRTRRRRRTRSTRRRQRLVQRPTRRRRSTSTTAEAGGPAAAAGWRGGGLGGCCALWRAAQRGAAGAKCGVSSNVGRCCCLLCGWRAESLAHASCESVCLMLNLRVGCLLAGLGRHVVACWRVCGVGVTVVTWLPCRGRAAAVQRCAAARAGRQRLACSSRLMVALPFQLLCHWLRVWRGLAPDVTRWVNCCAAAAGQAALSQRSGVLGCVQRRSMGLPGALVAFVVLVTLSVLGALVDS